MSAETVVFSRLMCRVKGIEHVGPLTRSVCHRKVCRNALLSSCTDCKCCSTQHPYVRVEVYCKSCVYVNCVVEDAMLSSESVSAIKEPNILV